MNKERLYRIIWKLEEAGWRTEGSLIKALRETADKESEEAIWELLNTFRF